MGRLGETLYEVITQASSMDIDGFGACEGTLSCSTCHVIFDKDVYRQLPDNPTDEEMDMLDLAYDLTDTYVALSLSLPVKEILPSKC